MSASANPGRVAGLWYLFLCVLGPLRLIYIPAKLFVYDNPSATVANIAGHQLLFRLGILDDLVLVPVLIMLVLAFYRLFAAVDRTLAVLVVILGGVMPATIYVVNTVADLGALTIVRSADFLAAFNPAQRDGLVMLLLRLHDSQNTAAEMLWGLWLLPLGILVYRSTFLPRILGVWLMLGCASYVALCVTGVMFPQYKGTMFTIAQPGMWSELAIMLWLVIKGATPATSRNAVPATVMT